MSFDVFAQAFRNGKSATANVVAARAVMSTVRHNHNPEFNSYVIRFADGSHLEMYSGGLDGGKEPFDGAMFALRGITEMMGDFMFSFTRAAGCVLFPAMAPVCMLLVEKGQDEHLPGWPMTFR